MIEIAIGLLARLGLSQRVAGKLAPWALAALACLLAGLLWALWLHSHDARVIETTSARATLEQLHDQVKADAAAADRRLADQAAQIQQKEAYHEAIDNPRPADAGDPGVRLACERLRRDGQDTAGLPACGGR